MHQLFQELKRRSVYKVAVAYAAAAFVVVQAARLLVPALLLPDWIYRAVVLMAILGFPIALVIAWAFELTPEGIQPTSAEGGETESTTSMPPEERPVQSRLAMKALAGLGLVGAAVAGGWYLMGGGGEPEPVPRAGDRSIAVLPFENMGGEASAQLRLGVHDGLLTRLSNISGLQVISRTSVMQYEDTEETIPSIARNLDARWVVEGAVQQAGGEIQVNAQLIDALEDDHRWAESYNRTLNPDNLFSIQSELTKKIARSLRAELSPQETERVERQPTQDLEAYRLYVEGRTHLDQRTEEGMRRALERFRQAIAQDSTYALAWSGVADARALIASYGYGASETLYPKVLEAARRALTLDPDLAEAHASMGFVHYHRKNGPAALRELRRAVQLQPSYARAYHWLGDLEAALGWPERALEHLRRAEGLDPNSPSVHSALAWTYWWLEGPGESALEQARAAVELEPGYAHGHEVEGLILSDAGRQEEAITRFHRALDRTSEGSLAWGLAVGGLGTAYVRSGDTTRAREMLARLQRQRGDPFNEARIEAGLGETGAALRSLRTVDWTIVRLWALRLLPVFDPLRDDEGFRSLIREANRTWGLNPDGSLPDSVDVSFDAPADD